MNADAFSNPGPELPRDDAPALVAAIDALLQQGQQAVQRYEELCRSYGLEPGDGQRVLFGPDVPPGERAIFRRLLQEWEQLHEKVRVMHQPPAETAQRSVGTRAISSRFRI